MLQWIVVEPGSIAAPAEPEGLSTTSLTGGTQVMINPVKDNTLYKSSDGSVSNGAGVHLFAGTNNDGNIRRTVVAFDVASSIPTGVAISSVNLRLNMTRTAGGPASISLHKISADWGQGSGTSSIQMPGSALLLTSAFTASSQSRPQAALAGLPNFPRRQTLSRAGRGQATAPALEFGDLAARTEGKGRIDEPEVVHADVTKDAA